MADRAVRFIPCGQPRRKLADDVPPAALQAVAQLERTTGRISHTAAQTVRLDGTPWESVAQTLGLAEREPAHGSLDTVSAPDHPRPVPGAGVSERGEGGREHAAGRPRYFSVQAALKAGIPSSGSSSSFSLRSVSGSSAVAEGVVVGRLRGTTETVASAASVSTSSNTLV